jgi:parallel beta-helix repeat protein
MFEFIENPIRSIFMETKSMYSKFSIGGLNLLLLILLFAFAHNTGIAQLSGSYTIGSGGDYATLKAAANDLMNLGIGGPVTMNVLSGTYNEHFMLNTISGTSDINTVTFQSTAGNPDSVWITYNASGADSNYVVKLDNIQYVTFQNLTFHSTGQYYSRIFDINATLSITSNITINNNRFHGDSLSSNNDIRVLIFSNDADIENIHILGNIFYGGSSAILLQGLNNNYIQGTNVVSNTFYSAVYCGVNISWHDSPVIGNNTIESNQYGIRAPAGIGNIQIRENRIKAGYYGISIGHFDASTGDRSIIVNNFVSVDGRYGISIGNSVNLDIYHNSVNVLDPYQDSKAFELLSTSAAPVLNVVNNSFACMEAGYAYYISQSSAVDISDYNNLYTAGNFIAYRDSNIISIEKLKTVSGKNLNSLSVFPHYRTDTDLHTIAPWLDNKGINLNYITHDIDGDNRDPATPDIGADEFTSNPSSIPYTQDLTVGSGGDFSTINEAIDSLVLRGVLDSVHINIMPGIYNEQVNLISIPGTNTDRYVILQSQTNDTAEIVYNSTDQYSNYTIRFKGADNIRLKNLKLLATGASYSRVVDYYRGANNIIVEYCVLRGMPGSGAVAGKAIIFSNDSYYESRIIRNNIIDKGTYSIFMRRDNNNYDHPKNPLIENNTIINNGYCGIYLQLTDFVDILSNTIQAENTGILLNSCSNQSNIRKNKIDVSSQYGLRISSCGSQPGHPITIFNNFIHVGGVGNAYGIHLNNSSSLFIFHNSVNITSTDVTDGRAFYLSSAGAVSNTLYNNIFKNSGGGYAYYVDNIGAIGSSDYNDLFTTGTLLAHWLGGRTNLADLQSASGMDINSVSADPLFVSDTDLHTIASVLDSAAVYQGVADDIDGQLRDPNFPDIGADEFGFFPNQNPVITSFPIIIARIDSLYEYQVIAADPDGDSLHFSFTYAPNFLSIDSISGLISGIPTISDTGDFPIEITVSDGKGGFDYQSYILHVISLPLFTIDAVSSTIEDVVYSCVAWGDYDEDGDLDILLTGSGSPGYYSKIYRNDNGVFTDINAGLVAISNGSVAWGDYDNDGDLDILLKGDTGPNNCTTKIYRNDEGSFTDINAGLFQVGTRSCVWGDYDNDGDLDIFYSGFIQSSHHNFKLYRNENRIFTEINTDIPGVHSGSLDLGDYDNDGDLDVLITGQAQSNFISRIYRNDNGVFHDINANMIGVYNSSVDWGDYDNDGDLDVLITGNAGHFDISRIYRNDAGVFTNINAGLTAIKNSSVAWGDYDNDGDLDILLTGDSGAFFYKISKIYRNDSGIFTDINAGLWGISEGTAAWGDYDNDDDLDIILSGLDLNFTPTTIIYQNNINSPNTIPTIPTNLLWNYSGSEISLNWNASSDSETPQLGLTYNLRIGSTSEGSEIKSAMSNYNGYRQLPELGNINHLTSWSLSNTSSNIYWSVQAVDHGFLGSQFSIEDSIILAGLIHNITDVPNDQGGKVSIRWQVSELDNDVNTLQHYSIWRAIPETEKKSRNQEVKEKEKSLFSEEKNRYTEINGKTYYWEWIADQPAHRMPYYSYTCETLYDSMSTTNGMHYFMISAHTNDPNIFFDSEPDSGYSVDNLAPLAPANLNGIYNNNQITLHWNPNKENDFKEYVLYRSTTPNINPATDTAFAVTIDTIFTDTNILPSGNIYYIVCARDIHDNLSSVSNEIEIIITGILKNGTELPKTYALYQNFPNPFNPYTVIKFDLPKTSKVRVNIFNSLGENVTSLVDDTMYPGKYQYIWKPENLSSGLYFYTIQADNFRSVKKMLLVK